jgi:hypothetical protein
LSNEPFGPAGLEKCTLQLDYRRGLRDQIEKAQSKLGVAACYSRSRTVVVLVPNRRWQRRPTRIDADAQGIPLGANGVGEAIGEGVGHQRNR